MFSGFFRILFAFSSASPIVLVASLVSLFAIGTSNRLLAIVIAVCSILVFLVGGWFFVILASRYGESEWIGGSVATVNPSAQWLPVLFGSYFVPLLSCLESVVSLEWLTAIVMIITVVALAGRNIPPALSLLLFGYRFYELSLTSGAGGYKLISKRKVIRNPKTIGDVVCLFDNEYWLLERGK